MTLSDLFGLGATNGAITRKKVLDGIGKVPWVKPTIEKPDMSLMLALHWRCLACNLQIAKPP
jgi:hypothetical protein